MRLENSVALVTGGGSGIGRAISEHFAQEGAQVVVVDKVASRAQETVERIRRAGGTALPVETDVADEPAVTAMARHAQETFGRVDILVNNAGMAVGDDILEMDRVTWDLNLAVVLSSVFLCSKAVLPGMIERQQGAIVNISSVNGLTGLGEDGYSAAKAGMINLTQNMAVRYGAAGIRVNAICPATIRTPIWQPQLEQDPQIFERLAKWYPLGRVGDPEDVAAAALFLASNEAKWITGIALPVDGGLTAGSYRMARELMAEAPDQSG